MEGLNLTKLHQNSSKKDKHALHSNLLENDVNKSINEGYLGYVNKL